MAIGASAVWASADHSHLSISILTDTQKGKGKKRRRDDDSDDDGPKKKKKPSKHTPKDSAEERVRWEMEKVSYLFTREIVEN